MRARAYFPRGSACMTPSDLGEGWFAFEVRRTGSSVGLRASSARSAASSGFVHKEECRPMNQQSQNGRGRDIVWGKRTLWFAASAVVYSCLVTLSGCTVKTDNGDDAGTPNKN